MIREDPKCEKSGFCLLATAYLYHPEFKGCFLLTDWQEGKEVDLQSQKRVTECINLMLDFVNLGEWSLELRSWTYDVLGLYLTNPFIRLPNKT